MKNILITEEVLCVSRLQFFVVIPSPFKKWRFHSNLKCVWHTHYKPHEGFDSLHGNSAHVAVHVQHMWGKKNRLREGQMDRALAPGSAMAATTPDVLWSLDLRIPPTQNTQTMVPKTWGWPAHSIPNATHPPRDLCTWADDWITPEETQKTIRPSKNLLMYSIVRWPALIRASLYQRIWHAAADWINWRSAFITLILLPNYRPALLIYV